MIEMSKILKDFKPQITAIAVLWLVLGLSIVLDVVWPILTMPPTNTVANAFASAQNGATTTATSNGTNNSSSSDNAGRAQSPLGGTSNNGTNTNNNNGSRAQSPLGNGTGSSSNASGQLVAQAPGSNNNNAATNNNNSSGGINSSNGGGAGILYPLSQKLPPDVSRIYLLIHGLIALAAIAFSAGFSYFIKKWDANQLSHNTQSFQHGQTLGTNPPVDDNANGISWFVAMTNLFDAWYNHTLAEPGNDSKARMRGTGGSTFVALELVSRRGSGIRHAVRLPIPETETDISQDAANDEERATATETEIRGEDSPSSYNTLGIGNSSSTEEVKGVGAGSADSGGISSNGKGKKPSRNQKPRSTDPSRQIPAGLVGEFTNLLISQYRWCEIEPYQPGEDLLDLDKYTDSQYLKVKERLLKTGKQQRGMRLARGYYLLALERPNYYPLKINFSGKGSAISGGGGADPLNLIYKALDSESDSELLACGVETVLGPPATNWQSEAAQALDKFGATEMNLGVDARYTRPTKAKGKARGGGLLDNINLGSSGSSANVKAVSPKQAAKNRRAMAQYQTAAAAIKTKLEERSAFPVYIYVWAEGTERAVTKRLPQIASAYTNQFNALTFTTPDGAADGNRFRIIKTCITPVEAPQSGSSTADATTLMTTANFDASKFNSKEEADAKWQELKRQERQNAKNRKNKKKVVTDALAQVRARTIPPYFKTEASVLNGRELAVLWHLPAPKQVQNDQLIRAGAMSPAPERDLVHLTVETTGEQIFSDAQWRLIVGYYIMPDGTKRYVGITEQGILRGMYLPAKPGSGKSSDILMYALQALTRRDKGNVGKGGSDWPGNSVIIVDPNGDLTKDFLDVVPRGAEFEDRILIVDFTDPEWVVGLNLMGRRSSSSSSGGSNNNTQPQLNDTDNNENNNGGSGFNYEMAANMLGALPLSDVEKAQLAKSLQEWHQENQASANGGGGKDAGLVESIAAAVLDIFIRNLGVNVDRTPNIFRIISNGVRLLIGADPYATLRNLVDLMLDPDYRKAVLAANNDPISSKYYEEEGEFEALFEKGGTAPAMGRLENLLRQESIRRVFCQRHQTLNIRQACDEGYVILFYFPPKMAGDKAFSMAVTFTLITQAIFSRSSDTAKELRRTVQVFLDEFQEMVAADKGSLEQWLSQARKFGGAIVLAHQYLAQIRQYWEVIKGTVGTFMPMMLDRGDAKEFTEDFATDEWPAAQVLRAFDRLPPFSKIAKIFDNGRKHNAVLLRSLSLPSATSNEDTTPLLVAITDPTRLRGYRLEPYAAHPTGTLQVSKQKGRKGMWEPAPLGKSLGIKPTTREYCFGLIEEMTSYLYSIGQFSWRLVSPDPEEAAKMGLTAQDIAVINSDLHKLRQCNELLIKIEAMPIAARTAFLSSEEKLSNQQWQVYLASRRGRNLVLNAFINANPGLIPNARDRIQVLSILKINVHIAEVDAETMNRPNPFLVQAETKLQKQRLQQKEANSEYYEVASSSADAASDDESVAAKGKKATGKKGSTGGINGSSKGQGSKGKGKKKKATDDDFYNEAELDAYDDDGDF